jgi:regulator of sigma E protease
MSWSVIYHFLVFQLPIGLVGLSLMVFVHELGHFLVAKWTGVKVHTFSIGFGKKLITFKRGDTEYALSAVPFGGYVAMAGESPDDGGYGNTDEFRMKPIPVRLAIAVAGPFANIVFAFFLLFGLYLIGVQEPVRVSKVGEVEEQSPAAKAGVVRGDEILKLNGKPVLGTEQFQQDVAMVGNNPARLDIRRNGKDTSLTIVPEINPRFGVALSGITLEGDVVVDRVIPDFPAVKGGIQADDKIVSVDGVRIPSASALIEIINGSKGTPVTIKFSRAGQARDVTLTPVVDPESKRYIIGIRPFIQTPTTFIKRGPVDAAKASVKQNIASGTMVFKTLSSILTGKVKAKALSGPLGIVQMIAASLRQGLQKAVEFMALLNTNLAVLNILPLAITDGGVVMFLLLEAIRRRPLSLNTQAVISRVGLSFFLLLFLFVTFQDIMRISWFTN